MGKPTVRALGVLTLALVICGSWLAPRASAKKSAAPDQHRVAAEQCAAARGPGKPGARDVEGCHADGDCKTGKNGRCDERGSRMRVNTCTYDQCFTDKDCPKGPCLCGHDATSSGDSHYCVTGNCRVDADCGAGGFCSPSFPLCSLNGPYGPNGYFCHTAKDECMTDDDCPKPKRDHYGPMPTRCTFSAAAARWTCTTQECPVG